MTPVAIKPKHHFQEPCVAEGISNGRRGPSPLGHQFEAKLGAEPASFHLCWFVSGISGINE